MASSDSMIGPVPRERRKVPTPGKMWNMARYIMETVFWIPLKLYINQSTSGNYFNVAMLRLTTVNLKRDNIMWLRWKKQLWQIRTEHLGSTLAFCKLEYEYHESAILFASHKFPAPKLQTFSDQKLINTNWQKHTKTFITPINSWKNTTQNKHFLSYHLLNTKQKQPALRLSGRIYPWIGLVQVLQQRLYGNP